MIRFTLNIEEANSLYPITFHSASDYYDQETVKDRDPFSFHQILIVLDGKGTLIHNKKSYPLYKGCAFFTAKNTSCEYFNEGGLISAFLTVRGPASDELSSKLARDGFLFIKDAELEKYTSLIRRLINDYHSGVGSGKLSVQAYSFFVDFLSQKKTDMPLWLSNAIKYINQHFDEKLTLEAIAQHSYVSVSKLCHDFKMHLSTSVFEYVMNIRLQNAQALLQESPSLMTKDVALRCGFFDVGYFCKSYRKKYGRSPRKNRSDI